MTQYPYPSSAMTDTRIYKPQQPRYGNVDPDDSLAPLNYSDSTSRYPPDTSSPQVVYFVCFCFILYSCCIIVSMVGWTNANSAFHPSGVGKWVPASAGKAKAGMAHSVSGCMRGVQVKLWDPLRTLAIPERHRGVFTTRRYTSPHLPYLTLPDGIEV